MATIHDVARAAGVSAATVSRSFAAKQPLRHETRQRVLREAEKLNYRPRQSERVRIAHTPHAGTLSRLIGFQYFASMASDNLPSNAFYGPVLAGAQSEADLRGMHLMLHTAHRHMQDRSLPQMIGEQAVPGMLLVGTADPEIMGLFAQFVPKIVLVDNRDPMGRHDCVVTDGFRGSARATQYLLELGHRRIAFVAGRVVDASFEDPLNGYACTLFHSGIDVDRTIVCGIDEPDISTDMSVSVDQVASFLREFSADKRPSAVIAGNDAHALAVMHACRQLKISVPADMSIIGFDDTDFSAHTYPALTTMRVDKEQMGRIAVRRLLKRLTEQPSDEAIDPPLVVELPVSLVERASCAKPARRAE